MKKLTITLALLAVAITTGCQTGGPTSRPYYSAGNFPWQYAPASGMQGAHWMFADPDQGWPIGLSSYPVPIFP